MATITNQPKFSVAIRSDAYKKLINETLGNPEVARKFIADISSVVSNNSQLQKCEAGSIISGGLMAQSLKLPLPYSLGFAYLVPYGNKAQFQIGWKGFVQLAQRTGQYKKIGVLPVHEGEYMGRNEFGEDLVKFSHEFDDKPIVGYFAYFELINGFVKTLYWTTKQCMDHAKRYSKAFSNSSTSSLWKTDFDTMAMKTVVKQILSKWGPMSVDMELALKADQAVIHGNDKFEYVDNDGEVIYSTTSTVNDNLPDMEMDEETEKRVLDIINK